MSKPSRIEVIAPGSQVRLSGGIVAGVLQVNVMPNFHVQYQCVWWDGNTRNTQWVEAWEVTTEADDKPLRIGFRGA